MSRVDRREFKDWKGFGARTRKCRESVGMTRERFAEMIGRTENYLLSLEKGDKSCSIHTLHQICTSLKESPDYILYGDGMEKEKENAFLQSSLTSKIFFIYVYVYATCV